MKMNKKDKADLVWDLERILAFLERAKGENVRKAYALTINLVDKLREGK